MSETRATTRLRRALAPVNSNQLDGRGGNTASTPVKGINKCDSTPAKTQRPPSNQQPTASTLLIGNDEVAANNPRTTTTAGRSNNAHPPSSDVFRQQPRQDITTYDSIELRLGHPVGSSSINDDSFKCREEGRSEGTTTVATAATCDDRFFEVKIVEDGNLSMEVERDENGVTLPWSAAVAVTQLGDLAKEEDPASTNREGLASAANGVVSAGTADHRGATTNNEEKRCSSFDNDEEKENKPPAPLADNNDDAPAPSSAHHSASSSGVFREDPHQDISIDSIELRLGHPVNESYDCWENGDVHNDVADAGSFAVRNGVAVLRSHDSNINDNNNNMKTMVKIVQDGDLSMEVENDVSGVTLPWSAAVDTV